MLGLRNTKCGRTASRVLPGPCPQRGTCPGKLPQESSAAQVPVMGMQRQAYRPHTTLGL